MIYSRANLHVERCADPSKAAGALNGVKFNGDGSTNASDGEALAAVGPADASIVHMPDLGPEADVGDYGVVLEQDHVKEAIKAMPRDARASLNHVGLTRSSEDAAMIEFSMLHPSGEVRRVARRPRREKMEGVQDALKMLKSESIGRTVVRLTSLLRAIETLEAACGKDKVGIVPVEVYFGEKGLMLRSLNIETGQRVLIGVAGDGAVKELAQDAWERGVFSDGRNADEKRVRKLGKKRRTIHR